MPVLLYLQVVYQLSAIPLWVIFAPALRCALRLMVHDVKHKNRYDYLFRQLKISKKSRSAFKPKDIYPFRRSLQAGCELLNRHDSYTLFVRISRISYTELDVHIVGVHRYNLKSINDCYSFQKGFNRKEAYEAWADQIWGLTLLFSDVVKFVQRGTFSSSSKERALFGANFMKNRVFASWRLFSQANKTRQLQSSGVYWPG